MINTSSASLCRFIWGLVDSLRIYEETYCTVNRQFRFPRSKRRRIRNKWKARSSNWRSLPDPDVYVMEQQGVAVAHPDTAARLRREVNTDNGGTP